MVAEYCEAVTLFDREVSAPRDWLSSERREDLERWGVGLGALFPASVLEEELLVFAEDAGAGCAEEDAPPPAGFLLELLFLEDEEVCCFTGLFAVGTTTVPRPEELSST